MSEKILIAGGTGLIGELIRAALENTSSSVRILTRSTKKCDKETYFHWDPIRNEIDLAALEDITTIINLSGAGVADKRWTKQRKKELLDSRVLPTAFLSKFAPQMPKLMHYISASGINCYPLKNTHKIFKEEDEYGTDFLSKLVEKWETAADGFKPFCKVTKLRISTVLSSNGGALQRLEKLFNSYIGSPLGSGNQMMSWIHEEDLIQVFIHVIEHKLEGTFNLTAEQVTNKAFSAALARKLKKPMIPFGVPKFALNVVLGEMAQILTNGVKIDASKIQQTGFKFHYPKLDVALNAIYSKE